ncbi:type-F conjugative transfer system secretin TraK [Rhodoferax sp.]|uniref:type-F conjugative transfer system secretin TraK n=1 Tax=Rhodoferax sp. TaxID=50421 RepID=UPI0027535CA7|nr:type-F conjugative transfer system secretin TraK [Rhodoferax sp.]
MWLGPAQAVQVLEGSDGASLYAKISKTEPTRITVTPGRVASLRVREGTLNIDPDEDTGQLFVTAPPGSSRPVNGFLTTDGGETYTLVLELIDGPSDSVVIRQGKKANKPSTGVTQILQSGPYVKEIKRLFVAMATNTSLVGVAVVERKQEVMLWKEASMTLEKQYIASDVVGERFSLRNVSDKPMVLDEREFYKPGVHAVAIDQLNLSPGGTTTAYVIRAKGSDE